MPVGGILGRHGNPFHSLCDRRWDIRFRSGETLSLPEGDAQARDALVDFAKRDGVARLLGQGIVRFEGNPHSLSERELEQLLATYAQ